MQTNNIKYSHEMETKHQH